MYLDVARVELCKKPLGDENGMNDTELLSRFSTFTFIEEDLECCERRLVMLGNSHHISEQASLLAFLKHEERAREA